jgi:CPA1 family monovalent cation:H+ antiporter
MISATDPAAVIDAVRRLRAPPPLATLFEAESLFNDGTAIVVFLIALEAVFGQVSVGQGVAEFVVVSVGSVLVGLVAGLLVSIAMSRSEEHLVEITLSLFLAYGAYVAADLLHLSGIIATVTAGIVLGSFGRRYGLSQRARETIDEVWEFIAFLLTGLVFLLIGLAITIDHLLAAAVPIAWAVVAITVGRAIVVYGLLGGSFVVGERLGLGARLPLGWLHVIFWGGLRGAVAVALALSLPADLPQRELLQGLTFGVVLFTLLVQGTTASRLLHLAGVERAAPLSEPAARG